MAAETKTPNTPTEPVQNPPVKNSNDSNTGRGTKAAVTVNQSKSERIMEIDEQLNNGVLSVDERAKLAQEREDLKGGDAQGVTNQRNDDDVRDDDDKKNSFKEDDIIKYMYNEWMIALFCWGGGKIEKAAGTAYARLERRIIDAGIRHRAYVKKAKGTNAYKTYENVHQMRDKTCEEIRQRDHKRLENVQNIARAIGDGKMTAESATDVLALAKYLGVDTTNIQKDSRTKEIIDASLKHKAIKDTLYQNLGITAEEVTNNPKLVQQKMKDLKKDKTKKELFDNAQKTYNEMVASQKKLCELGGRFALQETRKISFESMVDQTAILMAEAKILDAVAKNGNAFSGKDMTEVFKTESQTARDSLNKATEKDRNAYIAGTNFRETLSYGPTGSKPIKINTMGEIETYRDMAHRASIASMDNMQHLRIAEMGEKPRENIVLGNLNARISNKHEKIKQEKEKEKIDKDYQRGQQLEDFYNRDDNKPKNMGEEAAVQAQSESVLQMRRSAIVTQMNANTAEWNQHIASPIAMRIAAFKRSKEQELVAEGAKNKFQGWKIAPQSKEM